MDNKNIRTFWEINSPDPHAKMLYVNDAFGNGVYIEEGSLYYDPIYKEYCNSGRMAAHQIFKEFKPDNYFPATIEVNNYHKTFNTTLDFCNLNTTSVMYNNIHEGENNEIDYDNPCRILSFDCMGSYIKNNKYYISDDVCISTRTLTDSVAKSKLKNDMLSTDIFLELDHIDSATILKAVEVKYDIKHQFYNISIDIHLKELSIKVY